MTDAREAAVKAAAIAIRDAEWATVPEPKARPEWDELPPAYRKELMAIAETGITAFLAAMKEHWKLVPREASDGAIDAGDSALRLVSCQPRGLPPPDTFPSPGHHAALHCWQRMWDATAEEN